MSIKITQEFEMLVRDLTDQGIDRKEAESIARKWMLDLVK